MIIDIFGAGDNSRGSQMEVKQTYNRPSTTDEDRQKNGEMENDMKMI